LALSRFSRIHIAAGDYFTSPPGLGRSCLNG
jgi:hypothetical protein